jgi:hypothetical protein
VILIRKNIEMPLQLVDTEAGAQLRLNGNLDTVLGNIAIDYALLALLLLSEVKPLRRELEISFSGKIAKKLLKERPARIHQPQKQQERVVCDDILFLRIAGEIMDFAHVI